MPNALLVSKGEADTNPHNDMILRRIGASRSIPFPKRLKHHERHVGDFILKRLRCADDRMMVALHETGRRNVA